MEEVEEGEEEEDLDVAVVVVFVVVVVDEREAAKDASALHRAPRFEAEEPHFWTSIPHFRGE